MLSKRPVLFYYTHCASVKTIIFCFFSSFQICMRLCIFVNVDSYLFLLVVNLSFFFTWNEKLHDEPNCSGFFPAPTINRGCGSTSDYSGQMAGFLAVGQQKCATTSEGQRVSKLCICSYDGCNAQTMGQLVDNAMFNNHAATTVTVATGLTAFAAILARNLFWFEIFHHGDWRKTNWRLFYYKFQSGSNVT